MPTLATGAWSSPRPAGFTLLEVMVTLVLVGILTTLAVLSVGGRSDQERLAEEARRLAALLELNHQEAMLKGERRGVRFTATGYDFLTLDRDGQWQPADDAPLLKPRRLPAGMYLILTVEGRPVAFQAGEADPQVLLYENGEVTPSTLELDADSGAGFTLSVTLTGDVALKAAP
ncbi:MAG: type II secretion system minor pseudopilin GspH [Pseudomonadota bacterium]|nr:type II secretion system minor pseudopilin GspH [Pseudomonadota bacterium]